jgi:hypothetical protein
MFDGRPYQQELSRRVDAIRRLVDAAHPAKPVAPAADISRETRGIAIVLLFASYENLLTGICRGLLESAVRLRVGTRRLKSGIRLFAIHRDLQAIKDLPEVRIWRDKGLKLIESVSNSRTCTVDVDIFPSDGSFMKSSQVRLFCQLFELGDPASILKEVWLKLDTIVTQRNGIAHGRLAPEEVGRHYTITDLRSLIDSWELRWTEFIQHVASKASSRDFFRERR